MLVVGDEPPQCPAKKPKTQECAPENDAALVITTIYNVQKVLCKPGTLPDPPPYRFPLVESKLASIGFQFDSNRKKDVKHRKDLIHVKRFEAIWFWKYTGDAEAVGQLPSKFWNRFYANKLNEECNDVHMVIKESSLITHYNWHCLRWKGSGLISRHGNVAQPGGEEHKAIIYDDGMGADMKAYEDDLHAGLVKPVTLLRKGPGGPADAVRVVRETEPVTYDLSDSRQRGELMANITGVRSWCPDSWLQS